MLNRRRFLAGVLACPICASAARGEEGAATWNYEGPKEWGALDPSYGACSSGCQQSPIDITDTVPARIPWISLNWRPQAFEIVNNGHTIQANVAPGSFAQIGPNRYELKQFHFHRPSEHAFKGKRTAMEAHFVHANEQGKLAVLGVLLVAGSRNRFFAEIMKVAPTSHGEAKLKNPAFAQTLLPRRGNLLFRYEGSLTTPPCAETVEWNVYLDPVPVSQADIDAFAKIFSNNSRPLQPSNRRFILRSF